MATTSAEDVTMPTEDVTTPTDKKTSKMTLIATGAIVLGLLILVAGIGGAVYYVKKNETPIVDDDVVPVIDQETAMASYDAYWPECQGQIFTNQTAENLYSIDVRIEDKKKYGSMHVELYDGLIDSGNLIAKSSSKIGQGWTSFDFPTHPILSIPDYSYTFLIVPDNGQDVAVWYNDDANLEQGKRIIYNFTTKKETDGPAGSSLTFKLYATEYDETPLLVIDEETAILSYDTYWPECQGQIFVNEKARELYSIDVRIYDKYTYGSMHVEIYDGSIGSGYFIAKSSSMIGQGWTSFDFPTHPILNIPDHLYTFLIVPDNGQDVAVWYNDGANLGLAKRIIYNFTTKKETDGPPGSSLTFKLYATEYDRIPIDENVPVFVIDQELAEKAPNMVWPECQGQVFVNQTAKKVYSIDVAFYGYNYGPTHVELYDGVVGTSYYIAKSSTKIGQGWTTFDFPTYPILQIPDHRYSFIVVPENEQIVAVWYYDYANLEQGERIVYNYATLEAWDGPPGSSLTFKLYATQYDDVPIVDDVPVYVIDQIKAVYGYSAKWPKCGGQIFVIPTGKKLYTIEVRVGDIYNYGPMHIELYSGAINSNNFVAKSFSKNGQGWTSFDFPTHPTLHTPNYKYSFIVVPDNGQEIDLWYDDDANFEQGERIVYDFTTFEQTDGPAGSSLTFRLTATI